MKATEEFKRTIREHLDGRAAEDPLFALAYAKEGKSIDQCVNYIFNEVRKSGCNGFADDEIYSMAVHYYDEDNISKDMLKPIQGQVVVNHHVELSESEKEEARQAAIKQYQSQVLADIKRKDSEKSKRDREREKAFAAKQLSLFGDEL